MSADFVLGVQAGIATTAFCIGIALYLWGPK